MMRAAWLVLLLAPQDPTSAWKTVQDLAVPRAGPIKFSLPLETQDAARPGLEDLRILDDAGKEVPWSAEPPRTEARVTRTAAFKATLEKDATVLLIEAGEPQPLGRVELETPADGFIKPAKLEGSSDGAAWTTIVDGEPVFAGPGRVRKLFIEFAAATWTRLKLTLDDRKSAAVPVTGVRVTPTTSASAPSEPFDPTVTERLEEPGRTRLRLRFPARHAMLAELSIETPEPLFRRRIVLAGRTLLGGKVGERLLAEGLVFRTELEGRPPASRLAMAAELPLPERDVLLTVENGDSPPLTLTAIRGRRRPLHVVLAAGKAGAHRVLTGNPDVAGPRYDVVAAREVKTLEALSFSALKENPSYRAPELLPGLGGPGAALDAAAWGWKKPLALKDGPVHQAELDADVLARSAAGLGDLRLVRDGRQVPYLLERTDLTRPVEVGLEAAPDPKRPSTSRWKLVFPKRGLPLETLTVEAAEAVFQREFRLIETFKDERGREHARVLTSSVWTRKPGEEPRPLRIGLPGGARTASWTLEADDGDNAPLTLKGARGWMPVSRLLFKLAAGGTPVSLYYGNAKAGAPEYDLAIAAPQLLAAPKTDATLGAEERHSATEAAEREGEPGKGGWIFWGILATVVIGLILVITKLLPEPTKTT
jgi:hypothetical protein